MSPVAGSVATGKRQPMPRKSRCPCASILSPDQHGRRAHRDRVRRTRLDDHVALPRGGQAHDQHGRAAHRDHAADMRLDPVDQGTDVRIAARAPGRHAGNQHGRRPRPRSERRAVAGGVADAGGWLSHQLILTTAALALREPPSLRSSVPDASIVICGALNDRLVAAWIVIDPPFVSILMLLASSVTVMPSSSITSRLPSLSFSVTTPFASASSNWSIWPLRDLIRRWSLAALSLPSGGLSASLHSPPRT